MPSRAVPKMPIGSGPGTIQPFQASGDEPNEEQGKQKDKQGRVPFPGGGVQPVATHRHGRCTPKREERPHVRG
jgi:hypothetical protein